TSCRRRSESMTADAVRRPSALERSEELVSRPLRPFEEFWEQMRFWGESLSGMPYSLKWFRSQIIPQISDIMVGSGSWVIGGGMLFVIGSLAFFTGTQVGLEGVAGLEQI